MIFIFVLFVFDVFIDFDVYSWTPPTLPQWCTSLGFPPPMVLLARPTAPATLQLSMVQSRGRLLPPSSGTVPGAAPFTPMVYPPRLAPAMVPSRWICPPQPKVCIAQKYTKNHNLEKKGATKKFDLAPTKSWYTKPERKLGIADFRGFLNVGNMIAFSKAPPLSCEYRQDTLYPEKATGGVHAPALSRRAKHPTILGIVLTVDPPQAKTPRFQIWCSSLHFSV